LDRLTAQDLMMVWSEERGAERLLTAQP